MNLVSTKNIRRVFLHKNSSKLLQKEKVDIVLSPTLYWVRFFDIPVKNELKALEVTPTLFEDILDESSHFSYHVQKVGESRYLCFAYNEKEILELISNIKIPITLVNNIYFAQNEFKKYNGFSNKSEKFTYINDLLIKVPNKLNLNLSFDYKVESCLKNLVFSDNTVSIKKYSSFLSLKNSYILSSFLIAFICLFVTEIFIKNSYISQNNSKVVELKKINRLPISMIRTEAILKEYRSSSKNQIRIREFISYIAAYKDYSSSMVVENITFNNNIFKMNIKNIDSDNFKSYLNKKAKVLGFKTINNISIIEVKI